MFWPPEWVLDNKYFAIPATVWSLGVVLFELVSGDLPFQNDEEIVDSYVPFVRSLSKGEKMQKCITQTCRTSHHRMTLNIMISFCL